MSKHRMPPQAGRTPAEPAEAAEKDEAVAAETEKVEEQTTEAVEAPKAADEPEAVDEPKHGISSMRVLAYGVLPALALLLAMGAGYLKWMDTTARDSQSARLESVRVATESTVAMLSYRPDTIEKDLGAAAEDRMTGQFKDSYKSLTDDVVIPGAKQRQISAVANVPAAASVSATEKHAVVLVFINQTVTVGADPPTNTASSVRVTLEKISGRWMISDFTPV